MLTRITRIFMLYLATLLVLSGCAGGAFGGIGSVTEAVDNQVVVREVQSFERGTSGRPYEISLTVPEEWVGSFDTVNNGSVVTFRRTDANGYSAPVFYIHVLNFEQYWMQNGSYPGDYRQLASVGDTYFVYNAPVESYYSGLGEEEYQEFLATVDEVLTTFSVTPLNRRGM
ncbi:MAG: hypothetical protein ACFE0Q_13190 [Anaerolineae bacterium]